MSAIISVLPSVGERPAITFRAAGDRYVVVEYGDMTLALWLNFFVIAVLQRLTTTPIAGVEEVAPGFRSILVNYDPGVVPRARLIDDLQQLHHDVPSVSSLLIPSRMITLPIAFDDSASRDAVRRYALTTRADAPNVVDGNNIDYVARYNGMSSREDLYETILGTQWWNGFTGFFPGLPFMFPLDPRHEIAAPRYNPARMWTPEGAVSIGGPCVTICPMESPGSYQLIARTTPIFDLAGRHPAFLDGPILIQPGDRVRFTRVDEDELLEIRRQIFEDRYEYEIEQHDLVVADYLAEVEQAEPEASVTRARRTRAAAEIEVP